MVRVAFVRDETQEKGLIAHRELVLPHLHPGENVPLNIN